MPSEGSALDGQVKVTLSGDLAPLAVDIDETLMKSLSARELSDAVLTAMKSAHASSVERTRSELAQFYGSMGVPVPSSMGGPDTPGSASTNAASASPASSGASAGGDLAFDPIGLGGNIRAVD